MRRWAVVLSLCWLCANGQIPTAVAVGANGGVYRGGPDRAFVAKSEDGAEVWRTHLGSLESDQVLAITPGRNGNIWAAGAADGQGFIAELNPDGSVRSRGRVATTVRALTVDAAGSVYLARDGFIEKLAADGILEYSIAVWLPVNALATDAAGGLYVGLGTTVAKLDPAGTNWLWRVELGSTSAAAIVVDAAGAAHITGTTTAVDFFVVAASQPRLAGPTDAFVAKIRPDGSGFEWATYLGGRASDSATSIAVESDGNVWVAGHTTSPDFPGAKNTPIRWRGSEDGYLARLDAAGNVLESRYFGTASGDDRLQALAMDADDRLHTASWDDAGIRRRFTSKAPHGLFSLKPRVIR